MKTHKPYIAFGLIFSLTMFFFIVNLSATDIWKPWRKKIKKESVNFIFRIQSSSGRYINIDSALIVLDKYDLTGAGAVIKTVATDSSNHLNLTDIPVGKYYAGIYTYGLCKQYLPIVIKVTGKSRRKNTNTAKVIVADTDSYVMGQAVIPPENTRLFSYIKHYK